MSIRNSLLHGLMAASLLTLPLSALPAQAPAQQTDAAPARKTVARVSMLSADPDRLRRFYTEVFGFQPLWQGVIGEGENAEMIAKAWKLDKGARLNGMLMRAPRGDMELQVTYVTGQTLKPLPRVRSAAPFAGDHYFVIHVPDLDAALAKMKPFDIEFNRAPMKMTAVSQKGEVYAVYEAVIYDPEGTIVIIVQDV